MTAVAMPARTHQPPPPDSTGGRDRRPAPVGSILAVLGRLASHAGDPLTVTTTAPTASVTVVVGSREHYLAWRAVIAVAGPCLRGDDLGVLDESHAVLHDWLLTIRLVSGGR